MRLDEPVAACLEAAEIQRRVFASGGPAVLFTHVTGCRFPMVSNLFGTMERVRYLFRDTLERVRRLIELESDPAGLCGGRWRYCGRPRGAAWTPCPAGSAADRCSPTRPRSTSCRS